MILKQGTTLEKRRFKYVTELPDEIMNDDIRCPEVFDHIRPDVYLAPTPVCGFVQDHPEIETLILIVILNMILPMILS
jgi:hypothetical protein